MSVTTAALSTKRQIRQSLRDWRGNLDEDQVALFRAFVEDSLNRLRGPFLAQHPPRQILEYLQLVFRFTQQRKRDEVRVEVGPGQAKGLVVMTAMQDQPFIVDTIRLFLRRGNAEYWGGFNLVFQATRDEEGRLVGVGQPDGSPESLTLLEADQGTLLDEPHAAAQALRSTLELARAMVTDFKPMTRLVERFVDRLENAADLRPDMAESLRETADFLKWLLRENFVFMGVSASGIEYGFQRIEGPYKSTPAGDWPQPHAPATVQVRKSHTESPVHRAGRIDEILVYYPGERDDPERQLFLRGMFTYRAVTQPSRNVPILRRVLASILEQQQSRPGSFRYKGIANVFDSLPTEFLFTASRQAIAEMVDLVFEAEQQQEVGVTFLMTGADSAFCLVAMPKTQYSDELRRELEQQIVGTLQATYSDHGLFIGRYDTVLLHYYLTGVLNPGAEGLQRLTDAIRVAATPWLARLWHALSGRFDEHAADRLTDTYGRAFPETWVRQNAAERVVRDIEMLETLSEGRNMVADVFRDRTGMLTLRLYQARDVYLTEILPVLNHFGLIVVDSYATPVESRGGQLHMDTFRLEGGEGVDQDLVLDRAPLLVDALQAVFIGDCEDDRLNQLVLTAGLRWEEVDLLRGLSRYGRQRDVKISLGRTQEILLTRPEVCKHLVSLFQARFDPDLAGQREARLAEAEEQMRDDLRLIRAHDEDLLIGTLLALVQSTVRTNYYRNDREQHYLSWKIDCARMNGQEAASGPLYEVYVHHREVEGVHIRFGPVARGGIRWSDRDDFRTEVLGLATTQQVKNVVIVPEGAKGGFYLKRPPRDPVRRRQDAERLYEVFIRGLLDLTDNVRDGETIPPAGVVCHDGPDPYMVVAADKGTAHLSDTANKLSAAYHFWLGDAFASGGSNGYDHKKVGITARGAWVLVRRHFAEMGMDPYSEPFTCVGIGDMGGDVFGNGLIESPHARLLAAFNHQHIILDPDPDPQIAYQERLRLFRAERQGGWDHYDADLISAGGGVYERSAKSIPLSPQAQQMLNLYRDEAPPDLVVQHVLQMEVDLLWNGGIGTYVKASTETHADADDRSNDEVRIDATQLRARIIGEGGNLGLTQRGRIEADLCGVRLNTDFIDNSGGVDLSDHEVNLKILLDRVVSRGELTVAERNVLLRRMTDEVAGLVTADSDAQGRQISRDRFRAQQDIYQFGRAIAFIERISGLGRAALRLPTDKELARRSEEGLGLSRPELAVLSSWVKLHIYRELMAGEPKALPGYDDLLDGYFPKELRERWPDDIREHMLADEIAMAVATTRMVSDAGAAFFPVMIETTGRTVREIATAYLRAQALAQAAEVRATLEELRTSVSLNALYRAWVRVDAGAREVSSYWLSARGRIPTEDELSAMAAAADQVYALQSTDVRARNHDEIAEMREEDIPETVAMRILKAQYLNIALAVWSESERTQTPLPDMIVRHLAVARASRLQEVLDSLAGRPATGRWDPIAMQILHNRFFQLLRSLVVRCPINGPLRTVDELAPALAEGPLADVRAQVDRLLGPDEHPPIPTLIVLEERVGAAVSRLPRAR